MSRAPDTWILTADCPSRLGTVDAVTRPKSPEMGAEPPVVTKTIRCTDIVTACSAHSA